MSARSSHRNLQNFLRNASALVIFATVAAPAISNAATVNITNGSAVYGSNAGTSADDYVVGSAAANVPGTTTTLESWNFFGQTGTNTTEASNTVATGLDTGTVGSVTYNTLTRGTGATVSAGSNSFRSVGFKNDGIATTNTDYFQWVVSTSSQNLNLTSITARYNGTPTYLASPGVSTQYAYSLDGTNFTLIGSAVVVTVKDTLTTYDLSTVTALQNLSAGTDVYLRFYSSGQTGTGGWGYSSANATADGLTLTGSLSTYTAASGSGTLGINTAGSTTFSGGITSNSGLTLTAVSGGTAIFTGKITGAGDITKTDVGTVVISNATNDFSGNLTVNAGTLRATSSAKALGTSNLILAGGTLELANNTALNFGRNATVTGNATVVSDRLTSPGGAATHTLGTLSIGAQTLTIAPGVNISSGTAGIVFGAVTLTGAPTFTVNSGSLLTLASITGTAQNITINGAGNTTISGAIATTSGSLTKSGNGTLTLNGTNTFTGATTINGGSVSAASGALGTTSSIAINGGSLTAVNFKTNADLSVDSSGTAEISGTANQNVGTLTNNNSTTANAVNFSGAVGTVNVNSLTGTGNTRFGSNVIVTNGISSGNVNVVGTLTSTIGGGTTTVGKVATISSMTNGTLTLNGSNSTITTLSGGTVNLNNNTNITTLNGGAVAVATGVTMTVSNGSTSGIISGDGTVTKTSADTLILSGANTYKGGTNLNQGKIVLSGGSLDSGTVTIASGATLATSGVASAGSLSFVSGSNLDLSSAGLSLSGGLIATGGNLSYTLGNTLAVTGTITLSGTINIDLTGKFEAKRYDLLTFASGDATAIKVNTTRLGWTITPVITGTKYSLDVALASSNLNWNTSGDGIWDTNSLNWNNTSTSSTQAFVDGDIVTFDKSSGGVITLSGTVTPANVTVNSLGNYTFESGTLAGDGGITKSGNGKLTLSTTNTFTGEVVVNAGTLAVTDANALGATSTGTRIISGATFDISNNITLAAEALTLAGTGVAGVGALTGSSGVNTVSGPITLSADTLITSQGTTGLDILTLSGALTGSSSTLSIGGTADTTISGNISGSGLALNKVGDGVLTLSGTNNTYSGGTTITGGKIIATTGNLYGSITDNAILQIDQTTSGTFAGNITGSGELIKEGTGAATLSGTNTVSTITLNNGTLVIAGSSALPTSGAANVTGGSTLTLSAAGTYGASTYTVNLSPTNTSSIALNIGSGNAVTLASNLAIKSESQIAVPGASGVLTLSGILSGNGKLLKSDLGKIVISGTNNNFLGNTEIQNGTLTLSAGSSFGSGTLTMNANGGLATLELNESATVSSLISGVSPSANSVISIATGKTLTINESGTRTYGTAVGSNTFSINGLGGLTMAGSGELILDGTNSYTGLTSVTAGTLTANTSAAISSSASVGSNAILNLKDNQTLTSLAGSGEVRIADGKTFTLNNSSNQSFSGTFTAAGASSFTKSGSGSLTLSGANTNLARDVTVSAGTVKIANNSALGSGAVTITSGNVYAASGKTVSNNITIGNVASSGVTDTAAIQNWNFFGQTGANVTQASNTVASGLDTGTVGSVTYNTLTRGTSATVTAGNNAFRTVGFQNNGIATTNTDYFQWVVSSSSQNLNLNSITARYNGTATYLASPGVSTQYAYSLDGTNFTLIGSAVVVTVKDTLTTYDLSTVTALQNLSAGTDVYFRFYSSGQTTTGGWGYSSANATADGLTLIGSLSTYTPAGGSGTLGIDEAGTATFTGNVAVNNTATLNAATGGTAVFTGEISGLGSLTKTGNGTVELQGTNTFTGSLTLSAGNLKVSTLGAGGAASPLGAAADVPGSIIFNGGKLEYAGSGETLTRDFTVGNGGAGFISSGTGALVIGQDAQIDFDNAAASNRTLTLGGTTDIAVENIFNPKKFDAADITNLFTKLVKQDVNKWVVLGAGAGFVDADTTEMNVDGGELDFAMGSLGSKSKINVGSATLGWYNGNTEDVSGRIYLNSAATAAFNIPSGTVTLASALNGGAATTASLTKLGNGTLQLGAANNFSGGLNISAGTVKATTTGAVGSGTVSVSRNATFVVNAVLANKISVSSGGTLAGNGTDDDATVEEGGVLSPNADNVGMISFNKLTLNGGSHVKWQLNDATGAAGIGYDSLVVSVINLNNASSSKKIHVDVTSTGSFLHFDKTKVNKFEFAKLTTALANGVNVTDLFSIDASQFETDNNLINDHLVWSMQLSADRDVMYVTTMIPEPSTYGLGLSALALAVVAVRRRKKKNN